MNGRTMELISRVHLTWKRRITRNLAPYGLNPKQVFVLRRLQETGGLAPSQIADITFSDRPTVTSMIRTLEREGLVRRRRDPAHAKWVIVEITPRGRRKLDSVPLSLWRTGGTALDPEGCFTQEERKCFIGMLEKMAAWIQ